MTNDMLSVYIRHEEKMKVDRTYTQETTRKITRQAITWNPQGRGEEVGHETPGRETPKKKQRRCDTPREKWRRWPLTENGDVPWSMVYTPSIGK